MHRPPHAAVRVVLKKQVVHAFMKNQAIRIVHPMGLRREMVGWSVLRGVLQSHSKPIMTLHNGDG